jgi:aryl-alcohol dehydrogenase-like predicted oxidoreductase
MNKRRLGTSDLTVSEIGFGAWALGSGWWGRTDDPRELVTRAVDLGITFFDTGDAYGEGLGEQLLGDVLADFPRDEIQIATKFGYVLDAPRVGHGEAERPQDWSPRHLRKALDASLRRLRTGYIDLYQLHNPRMDAIEHDELFEELERQRTAGKVRHYGVALGPAIGWREEGLRALRERRITSLQTVYNMLERQPGEDFLAAADGTGAGILARVPTSSGLLEGHFTSDTKFGPDDHRRHRPASWLEEGLPRVERLRFLERAGRTMSEAAVQFILQRSGIASTLPTITTVSELERYAAAASAPPLSDDELLLAERALEDLAA